MTHTALVDTIALQAKLFHGFGDPSRLAILAALRERPHTVGEIVAATGLSQPNVSNHLACLRDCGLVVTAPDGRRTRYELADARLGHALDDLRAAVVAVAADRTCPDAATRDCC